MVAENVQIQSATPQSRTWARLPRSPLAAVALVLLTFVLHLPGLFTLPPIDRDEPRFADASRHMLGSDKWTDWALPVYDGKPRLNKPPLIYWIQAGVARLVGASGLYTPQSEILPTGQIGRFRLASYLGTLVAVLAIWGFGSRMFAPISAFLAAVLFASSMVVMCDVRQARTDEWLTAWTVIAMGSLWQVIRVRGRGTTWPWAITFWLAMAMGILTKGPVCPVICGGAIAMLVLSGADRAWLRRLGFGWGIPLVLLMIAAWLVPVGMLIGFQALWRIFADEVLWRAALPKEGHFGLPGYHLVLLPVLFWPGSLAIIPAAVYVYRRLGGHKTSDSVLQDQGGLGRKVLGPVLRFRARMAGRRISPELFCLAWLVPGWIAFELSMTKLPHYVLPLCPALALLCARALLARRNSWQPFLATRFAQVLLWGWAALCLILSLGQLLIVVPIVRPRVGPLGWGAIVIAALAAAIVWAFLTIQMRARRFVRVQILAICLTLVVSPVMFRVVLPRAQKLWISSRLVARLKQLDPAGTRPLAAIHYQEDSLVYLTEGRLERLHWYEVPEWIEHHPDGLVIMPDTLLLHRFREASLALVKGYNLGGGAYESLKIARMSAVAKGDAAQTSSAR